MTKIHLFKCVQIWAGRYKFVTWKSLWATTEAFQLDVFLGKVFGWLKIVWINISSKKVSCFEWENPLHSSIKSLWELFDIYKSTMSLVVSLSSKSKNKCQSSFALPGFWTKPIVSCKKKKKTLLKAEISLGDKVEGIVKSASRWHTHSALCFPTKAASIQIELNASVQV